MVVAPTSITEVVLSGSTKTSSPHKLGKRESSKVVGIEEPRAKKQKTAPTPEARSVEGLPKHPKLGTWEELF